jgi:hypothetical protein
MPSLTIPNVWGDEGFNVIREGIMQYCERVKTPIDLGYAFQWDNSVMLIRDSEGLDELTYANCNFALNSIYHYLCQGSDPWKAVKQAKEEWEKDLANSESAMSKLLDDQKTNGEA